MLIETKKIRRTSYAVTIEVLRLPIALVLDFLYLQAVVSTEIHQSLVLVRVRLTVY